VYCYQIKKNKYITILNNSETKTLLLEKIAILKTLNITDFLLVFYLLNHFVVKIMFSVPLINKIQLVIIIYSYKF